MTSYTPGYIGTMHGPDHIYATCPALARVKPWPGTRWDEDQQKVIPDKTWPRRFLGEVNVEDDPCGDVCGWCKRVWRARNPEVTDD